MVGTNEEMPGFTCVKAPDTACVRGKLHRDEHGLKEIDISVPISTIKIIMTDNIIK